MEKTRRGRTLLAIAAVLYLAAYAFTTLVPAILATLLIGYLVFERLRFQRLVDELAIEAESTGPDRMVYQDDLFTIERTLFVHPPGLRVQAAVPATDDLAVEQDRLTLQDTGPDGMLFEHIARLVPTRRGRHRQETLALTLSDPDGLFRHRVDLVAPVELTAHAPRSAFDQGRQAERLEAIVNPRQHEPGTWSEEILALREHIPSDLPRDIDWKASSRFEALLTRTSLREVDRPVVVVLDASRSMRHRTRRGSMLDHASQLATALVAAAHHQGTPAGLVAHDAHRVLDHVPPSRERAVPRQVARAIAELPGPIDLPPAAAETLLGTPQDQDDTGDRPRRDREPSRFEQTVAPFLGGAGTTRIPHGLSQAVRQASGMGQPRTIVVITDLQGSLDEVTLALKRAHDHQHRVLVASTFTPWFHLHPDRITAELLEQVYGAWQRHRRLTRKLEAMGVDVIDIAPETQAHRLLQAMTTGGPRRTRP